MTFVNWAHPEDPLIIRKGGSGLGNAEEDNMFEWLSKEGSLQRCKALESLLHNFLILPFCATISLIPPSRSPLSMVKSQDIFVNMLSDSAALDYELMWDSSQCFIQFSLLSLVISLEIPVNILFMLFNTLPMTTQSMRSGHSITRRSEGKQTGHRR